MWIAGAILSQFINAFLMRNGIYALHYDYVVLQVRVNAEQIVGPV